LTFKVLFRTAFKTRSVPQTDGTNAGQVINPAQNVPGGIYNSESNFVLPVSATASGSYAGLADYGTRLKATFNNVPNGVTLWVSVSNVNNSASVVPAPTPVVGGQSTQPYAQLVSTETGVDTPFFPSVSGTDDSSLGAKTIA